MNRRLQRLMAISTVFSGLAVLTGCSDNENQELSLDSLLSAAESAGHKDQVAALEDGVITVDEYGELNGKFLDCARKSGLQVSDTDVSPVDGFSSFNQISWEKVGEKAGAKAFDRCTETYLSEATPAMVNFGEWATPEEVLLPMRECVEGHGLVSDKNATNYRDLFLSVSGKDISVEILNRCLSDAIEDAYGEPQEFQRLETFVSVALPNEPSVGN